MQTKLNVKGMHCQSCEKLLTISINEIDGVHVQSISYKTGQILIDYDDESKLDKVKAIIEDNGYSVLP